MGWTDGLGAGIASGVLSGVAGLGGAALSGGFSSAAAMTSYKHQKRLLQMQMDYQERMSNTAHQREIADLRAAGLNPILSGMGGSGATSAGTSAPSTAMATTPDFGSSLSSAVGTGVRAYDAGSRRKQVEQQGELIDGQIKNLHAQTMNNSADAILKNSQRLQVERSTLDEGLISDLQRQRMSTDLALQGAHSASAALDTERAGRERMSRILDRAGFSVDMERFKNLGAITARQPRGVFGHLVPDTVQSFLDAVGVNRNADRSSSR